MLSRPLPTGTSISLLKGGRPDASLQRVSIRERSGIDGMQGSRVSIGQLQGERLTYCSFLLPKMVSFALQNSVRRRIHVTTKVVRIKYLLK